MAFLLLFVGHVGSHMIAPSPGHEIPLDRKILQLVWGEKSCECRDTLTLPAEHWCDCGYQCGYFGYPKAPLSQQTGISRTEGLPVGEDNSLKGSYLDQMSW